MTLTEKVERLERATEQFGYQSPLLKAIAEVVIELARWHIQLAEMGQPLPEPEFESVNVCCMQAWGDANRDAVGSWFRCRNGHQWTIDKPGHAIRKQKDEPELSPAVCPHGNATCIHLENAKPKDGE